EPA
ncbi:tail assembly protein I, partial [Escherichia coli EC1862]